LEGRKAIAWIEKSGRRIQVISKEKAFGAFLEATRTQMHFAREVATLSRFKL
jgi:hypothetical protein